MKRTSFTVAVYLMLVFASGIAVGGFGYHLLKIRSVSATTSRPRSPEEYRRRYTDELRTRLNLTSEQVDRLNTILDETRTRWTEFREKTRPEFKAIQQEQTSKIRSILTDVQRTEYEKMLAEREARARQRGSSGPGC